MPIKGHVSHASDAANAAVASAWENNADPRGHLGYDWLGPVVKVHQIDGYAEIVEYIRRWVRGRLR